MREFQWQRLGVFLRVGATRYITAGFPSQILNLKQIFLAIYCWHWLEQNYGCPLWLLLLFPLKTFFLYSFFFFAFFFFFLIFMGQGVGWMDVFVFLPLHLNNNWTTI